jgi:arsenate reductase
LTVYGIPNCDTCRKALKWLDGQGIAFRFHDLRADGLKLDRVNHWLDSPFSDRLVNRRSTTWRGLSEAQRAASGDALARLLVTHPTLVKRPVFERGGEVLAVDFDPKELVHVLT